jgi:ElaB/YqjD/DUF883 family membrane-anchored ribosome-binding protein
MGEKYRREHPEDPYDLTDVKGIASELVEEATDDAKAVAGAVSERVSDTASDLAADVSEEAEAAYEHPGAYAKYTLRRLERRARERPLDTLAVAGAIAFLAGALWSVVRRPRRYA